MQAGDHDGRRIALAARLEGDGEAAGVGRGVERAGADEGGDAGDGGIVLDDIRRLNLQRRHRGNGDVLRAFRGGDDGAGILLRQEAFRNDDVEDDGAGQGGGGDEQHRAVMAQGKH